MKIERLNEIVRQADLRMIKRSLKDENFFNCKRDKSLRRVSLYDMAMAPHEKTLFFPDGKGNEWVGDLIHGVKSFEQYEFVIVQLLAPFKRGREDLSTKKMLIYAKEAIK